MLRKAELQDIPEILKLVNFWAKRSRLLPVTKKGIKERMGLSWVWEEPSFDSASAKAAAGKKATEGKAEKVVGYVSLLIYRRELAEIRSLCVERRYQWKGIGTELLKKTLQEAKKRKITTVLTITIAPKFYKRVGFTPELEGKHALLIDPRKLRYS